jgi:peptidoglycan/LPS O-acetylase OafA/YrhL
MEKVEIIAVPPTAGGTQAASIKAPGQEGHKGHERNFGLDLIRCAAILLVMIGHGLYLIAPLLPEFVAINLRLTGHWGVQLFFVLSGFLIGGIFIKEIGKKEYNKKFVLNFWKRRWFRTVPNYLLFLSAYVALNFALSPHFRAGTMWGGTFLIERQADMPYFPFFLQNFLTYDINWFGHSWSLAVEEWFYLLLPAFTGAAYLLAKKRLGRKSLLFVFATVGILFLSLRTLAILHIWPGYTNKAVIYNLDHIMAGVLLAWGFFYKKDFFLKNRKVLLVFSAFLFLAGLALQNRFGLTSPARQVPEWEALILPLQTLAFTMAIPWFYVLKVRKSNIFTRLVTEISLVSYSMYLCHFMVLVFVIDTVGKFIHIEHSFFLFFLFLVVTVCLSAIIYRVFETKMTALRDKI